MTILSVFAIDIFVENVLKAPKQLWLTTIIILKSNKSCLVYSKHSLIWSSSKNDGTRNLAGFI